MLRRVVAGALVVTIAAAGYAAMEVEEDGAGYIQDRMEIVKGALPDIGLGVVVEASEEAEQAYTFEDFVGNYGHFSPDEPVHVDSVITIKEENITVGWWLSEYETMEITGKTIEGDTLVIEYVQKADGAYVLEDTSGTIEVTLQEIEGTKFLLTATDQPFYAMTEEELAEYEYELPELHLEDM